MSNYIYQDMSHSKRVALLKKLCKTKETITYGKILAEVELNAERQSYANDAMRISQIEDEMKTLVATYKGKINAIKKTNIERLEVIANEKRQVYGQVFGIPDHQNDRMMFYDEDGQLVQSRELLPNEKQGVLFLGEDQQTASNEEAKVAESVLDQFPEGNKTEAEQDNEESDDYEPSVQEEAPDESFLQEENEDHISDADYEESEQEGQEEDVYNHEAEGTDDEQSAGNGDATQEDEEDWRPTDLKEATDKSEGKEKKKRAPRKKKDQAPPETE